MQGITVRSETTDDIKAIDVVHLSAFEGDDEVGLVEALRESSGFRPELSLVAEFHGRIVGHVLMTPVRLQRGKNGLDILALAPMAVVPSQSHRGIGSELVTAAMEMAGKHGFPAIVVIGHPDFYQHCGFLSGSQFGLSTNLPVAENLISAVEIEKGSLKDGGHVIYPSQFNHVY